MLQAYVVEGGSLKPVSGDLARLSGVYWIDICEPTPDEQKAVEQALGIRLRLPEEPAKFQIFCSGPFERRRHHPHRMAARGV